MHVGWLGGFVHTLRNNVTWDWDIASIPAGPAGSIATVKGNPTVIPVDAPNPEAAWEFQKFLASEDAYYIYGREGRYFPMHRGAMMRVINDSAGLPPANMQLIITATAEPLPAVPGLGDIHWMRREELQPVWRFEESPQAAGIRIAERSVAILADAQGR